MTIYCFPEIPDPAGMTVLPMTKDQGLQTDLLLPQTSLNYFQQMIDIKRLCDKIIGANIFD